MHNLRVIAVENSTASSRSTLEPVIACVYKDDQVYIYDTEKDLYLQVEYIRDLHHLESLWKIGKYLWTDFQIEKGSTIARDYEGIIYVDDKKILPISKLPNAPSELSSISLKLFYEFLKTIHRVNNDVLEQINSAYAKGRLKERLLHLLQEAPIKELLDIDSKLVVLSRLKGLAFPIEYIKEHLKSSDYYKIDDIYFFFTRIFKLEQGGYIKF